MRTAKKSMTKARPTAGTWVVDRTEKYYRPCVRMNGFVICYLADNSEGVVAGKEVVQAEDAANAQLIAAAPDLLVACEAALVPLKDAWAKQTEGPDLWPIFEAMRNAVALAKGKTR